MRKVIMLCIIFALCTGAAACRPLGEDLPKEGLNTVPGKEMPEDPVPKAGLPDSITTKETVMFIDSLEREVPLPQPLNAIAPGNEEAQAILFSIAPDKLAGWYSPVLTGGGINLPAAYTGLPVLCGTDGGLDVQAAKDRGAQAILFMGSALDAAELDALSEQAGLPVLFVDSGLDSIATAYRTLGGLFGMEEAAEERVEYLEHAVACLLEYEAAVQKDARLHVYLGTGEDGLTPAETDILALAAVENAAAGQAAGPVTPAALKMMNIDGVILETPFAEAGNGQGVWSEIGLEAVDMGLVYQSPNALFSWMAGVTTPGKIMGAQWLGNLLYPDIYQYNMIEETKLHYDFFWHCQLTDDEAAALLKESTLRPRG